MSQLTKEQQEFLAKQKQVKKEESLPGFDFRNRITTADGEVEKQQDYFIHLQGNTQLMERPPGSGNLFHANGEEAGRFVEKDGKKVHDKEAEHIAVESPKDEMAAMQAQLKAAQLELDAIKKEKEAEAKEKAMPSGVSKVSETEQKENQKKVAEDKAKQEQSKTKE